MSALPNEMANGSGCVSNGIQIWERPWTIEEMRQHSASWSLAADSGLFLFLQDFSHKMLSKTHEIEKQLDSLISDTKATDSRLHSVFNDFLMLSNTQFIENRVYDEEVEETGPKPDAAEKLPDQEKSREQKEAELIPKMQEAVNYGLKVLESAFEHLDIKAGNSDSEDEDLPERADAILEPKDLYVDRPLPYLIGSQAFMEQDDVGLGDLSSDEMSVDSDRDSVIDSDDEKEAVHSDDDFYQEEQGGRSNITKKSSMISYEEDDEDSDIFGDSDKDEDDDGPKNTGPSSFADELAARIKGEAVKRPDEDGASLSSKKKGKGKKEVNPAQQQAAEDDDNDMFKPPKMEDEDFSPFGVRGGLFSGGKGLFDDDDEGDLFSEAPKATVEEKSATNEGFKSQTAEPRKSDKKIPAGAVSIFSDTSLFGSNQKSDPEEKKENRTPVRETQSRPKPAGGGGLFDDEDDDDFFGSSTRAKPPPVVQEKPKKIVDLFDDEEDDDIFSGKLSAAAAPSKKEVEEEKDKPPEKKMPPGAVSMFGPATKSLLTEGLKKRQPSANEDSEKSVENGADVGKTFIKQSENPQISSLFSDDEDSQVFTNEIKSQPKPEPTYPSKPSKAATSLFDDEDEEDLFATAVKSKGKTNPAKVSVPQPSKAVPSSLFSDDEDQWIGSKDNTTKSDMNTGGTRTRVSASSNLPNTKTSQKSSLFDDGEEEDDDLFAPTKEPKQKKPQRVALLFEDEGDDDDDDDDDGEDKGYMFEIKTAGSKKTESPPKAPVEVSKDSPKSEEPSLSEPAPLSKSQEEQRPAEEQPDRLPALPQQDGTESKKKPAGAVSLFGGIDILANRQAKGPLDDSDHDDLFVPKEEQTPNTKKEQKGKAKTVSLFDTDEEDESEWNDPIFTPQKPPVKNTAKPTEERREPKKSTGVFQDEELLFSQTQQKDNDPDVDLFSTSEKSTVSSSKVTSAKPAALSLFSDDDEDDIFSSAKTKPPPPKVAEKPSNLPERAPLASPEPLSEKPASSPVKPKDSSSRIGKLQASLMINPAALLPGAVPSMSGALSSSSGVSSSSLSPSPASTPIGAQADSEGGVSFDTPVQVTTLQSTHKSRVKGSALRRPQSRAARQQAATKSVENNLEGAGHVSGPNSVSSSLDLPPKDNNPKAESPILSAPPALPASSSPLQPSSTPISTRPSELPLPVTTSAGNKDSSKESTKPPAPSDHEDLFSWDNMFVSKPVTNRPPARKTVKTTQSQASSVVGLKKDDIGTITSIFDDDTDDLFQHAKPRTSAKKAKTSPFLEDDEDGDDIFGIGNSSTATSRSNDKVKNGSSISKTNIFQDETAAVPQVQQKLKKTIDASLFDDNVDIFADLSEMFKPKQKSKTKEEAKSIFDDDMDDIFTTSTVKAAAKASDKSKKPPPSKDNSLAADSHNIFDDPLNALGGK